MKKNILPFVFVVLCAGSSAQNLVPNPSFEQYSNCPSSLGQINLAVPWINATSATPDYLHQCSSGGYGVPNNIFGNQQAHDGGAYCGIVLYYPSNDYREYVEIPLTETLIAEACYYFEMYVNIGEVYGRYTTDDIGVYFSNTLITSSNTLPLQLVPQIVNAPGNFPDTASWTLVSGMYVATGGENYLIIGNFQTLANTTIQLANSACSWEESYAFVDDVSLIQCETGNDEHFANTAVKFYPNPFTTKATLLIPPELIHDNQTLILYDITGREALQFEITNHQSEISRENLSHGMYFYRLVSNKNIIATGKIIIE